MKEEDNKNLNISKSTDKSETSNKDKKINDTTLSDSKIKTTENSSLYSSCNNSQEKLNNESSASFLNKISSLIKSSYDSKHDYKYSHEEIISNTSISEEIKDLYNNHYSVIEEKLNNIRAIKKDKESARVKLQPGYFNEQDKASEELINKLSQEIDALAEEKEALKNSFIFFQSVISKDIEKIKSSIDRSNGFENSDVDYIDVANKNSDSYDILELLKEEKYKQLINISNTNKYNSLNNNEQLEFLKYLALNQENSGVAKHLFGACPNLRIDIFNHYIRNEFWINIYTNEGHQGYAENFYELSAITNNALPNIPFWGIIILSRNQGFNNEEIANIINNFLNPQLPEIIYIIDSYQNNTSNEISENHHNLISNVSKYLKEANPANRSSVEENYADSIKKIQNFQSSYMNSSNSLYNTVENLSTINPSNNLYYADENSYEYYLHKITNSRAISKYEIIFTYNTPNNAHIEQIHNQIQPSFVKPVYEYIQINKKHNKDKINEKKIDKKDEEKKSNDDNKKDSNDSQIPAFIKGGVATVTAELILFIVWSAYLYWHQNSILAKHIEKITEDLKKLSTIEPTIIIKLPNKIKSIFDTIYEEDEEEDYYDIDDELINLNTPIYHNKTECTLVELLKPPEEIIATPFFITSLSKQINFLIKPDSEHSLCQKLDANDYYVDAMEI